MKKIINDPNSFVDEALEGLLLAHPGELKAAPTTAGRSLGPTLRSRARSAS